jgi:prephenate dehydrogenase
MAGKEQRGAQSADPDLFRNRPYVLTPAGAETEISKSFRAWLARIGANIIEMAASEHDAVVAFTSHLPQLISTSLATTLVEQENDRILELFGPGLLDMTRLALSTPDLWQSIVDTNKPEILEALDAFSVSISNLRNAVLEGDLDQFFCIANRFARILREPACRR